jgi:hypothetical protein
MTTWNEHHAITDIRKAQEAGLGSEAIGALDSAREALQHALIMASRDMGPV